MRFYAVGFGLIGWLFLLLFDGGEAEEAELLSESEVFAVCICRKVGAVKMEFSVFVDQTLIHMYGDNIGDEHIMRTHRDDIGDTAGKGQRRFCDHRAGKVGNFFLCELAGGELVDLGTGVHTAVVGGIDEVFRG